MTHKEKFIDYVKNGGKQICSPQIGGGAGFDSKIVSKKWLSETTIEDTIFATQQFAGMVPLYNIGVDFGLCNNELAWKVIDTENTDEYRKTQMKLETKVGALYQSVTEEPYKGGFRNLCPVTKEDDLKVLEYYIDTLINSDFSPIEVYVKEQVDIIAGRGALDVQWATQPYELLCFPDTVNTVMLAMDIPDRFKLIMDRILLLNKKLFKAVKSGGADFVFLGGPASEIVSPYIYDEFIVPYSQMTTEDAHNEGLLIYSHICSPIEPFLTKGYYNQMGIDLFETLSPPPVGNVVSIADALSKIDSNICTRGNLGLDVLLNSTPEIVREKTLEIINQSKGRKHIVAASDYLFYDTPIENVQAMVNVCGEVNQ